jgi:parallel beta-helix repeat protein
MRRMLPIILLISLIVSMFTLSLNIQNVEAGGTIYIGSNGSVDPPTANVTSLDNMTYTFTDNNYDQIVIQRDNIVVDGSEYTLQGSGVEDSIGMDLRYRSNVTIKNVRIEDFWIGIHIDHSSSCHITGNDVGSIGRYGILLWSSSGNSISENNVTNNAPAQMHRCGVYLGQCYNGANNITANNITRSDWGGIYVDGASKNRFSWNVFVDCGIFLGYNPYDNIVENNLVNDKPLVYLEDESNLAVEDAGQVILVNCSGITVQNLNLSNTSVGVELWDTSNSTVAGNVLAANSMANVMLWSSSGNNISKNKIKGSLYDGVYLWYSSGNRLYHNSIEDNLVQALVGPSGYSNLWTDGYPSGGNYWSDYAGTDLCSGPYQNETGSDGIGDTPYVIDANNQDHYPVMTTWLLDFIGPTNHPIVDFAVYNESLYAAADNKLYVNEGSGWNVIDAPAFVTSLEPYGDKLVVGGHGGLYCYDGSSFSLVFSVPTYIGVLGVHNNTFYAGTMLDNPPRLYYCNGSADNPSDWHVDTSFSSILNFSGAFGSIDSFAVYGDVMYLASGGKLYSFNGTNWSIAASYNDVSAFLALEVYDSKLYLATRDQGWRKPLYQGGTGFSGRVIEFDGENWTDVFDHDYWVYSLEVYDGKLYAGTANKILTFNGTDWETSFDATGGAYYAISMITYDGKIYAGMGNGYIFADPAPPKANPKTMVPEFSSNMIPAVFMALTMLAAALIRKNRTKRFD